MPLLFFLPWIIGSLFYIVLSFYIDYFQEVCFPVQLKQHQFSRQYLRRDCAK